MLFRSDVDDDDDDDYDEQNDKSAIKSKITVGPMRKIGLHFINMA